MEARGRAPRVAARAPRRGGGSGDRRGRQRRRSAWCGLASGDGCALVAVSLDGAPRGRAAPGEDFARRAGRRYGGAPSRCAHRPRAGRSCGEAGARWERKGATSSQDSNTRLPESRHPKSPECDESPTSTLPQEAAKSNDSTFWRRMAACLCFSGAVPAPASVGDGAQDRCGPGMFYRWGVSDPVSGSVGRGLGSGFGGSVPFRSPAVSGRHRSPRPATRKGRGVLLATCNPQAP